MTVAEAAKAWLEAKRAIAQHRPALEAAEEVLKAHFQKTGKTHYKGLIGYAATTFNALNTKRIRAELDPKLVEKFEEMRVRETLSILGPKPEK